MNEAKLRESLRRAYAGYSDDALIQHYRRLSNIRTGQAAPLAVSMIAAECRLRGFDVASHA